MNERFDAVVIGSGAGGAPVAYTLARAGAKVLVLDKGPRYRSSDFERDEILTCRRNFWVPPPDDDPHVVVEDRADRITHEGWISQCVGGGTVHMSGFFFRFHESDFRIRSSSPDLEGTTVIDWPFGYEVLAPYYDRVEKEVGVSGDVRTNPYAPPRTGPFPYPPVAVHPVSNWIERAARDQGLNAFPVPRAILTMAEGSRGACHYHRLCGSYGCENGAKSSTLASLLPRAEATGNCEIRPDTMVERIEMRRNGTARGVVVIDASLQRHRVEADVVVVACGAIESARLLLLSAGESHPDGLGNRRGQVGKNLCLSTLGHVAGSLFDADFAAADREVLRHPAPFVGRAIQDMYDLDEPIRGLSKAGTIHFLWAHENPIHRADRLLAERGLIYGDQLMKALREKFIQSQTLEAEIFSEWLPTEGCFVELDPQQNDRWGLPSARIHLAKHPASVEACTRLVETAESLLTAVGCRTLDRMDTAGTTWVLQAGTCRMGTDPETSVTDPAGRVHDVPNVIVSDGGALPSNGGVPNTMTILANALRIADQLVKV